MRESDIVHESVCGRFWVGRDRHNSAYVVFETGATYSESDSAYEMDSDGLSIAIARCDYLSKTRHHPLRKNVFG